MDEQINILRFPARRGGLPPTRPMAVEPPVPKPGSKARAVRYAIDAVSSPDLCRALNAWNELAGSNGTFRQNVDGGFADIAGNQRLLLPRSTIALIEAEDPCEWPFLYCGQGFSFMDGRSNIGRKVGDLPSKELLRVTTDSYFELLSEGKPAVHRISGMMCGEFWCYDRIWLPIADAKGDVSAFITVTQMLLSSEDVESGDEDGRQSEGLAPQP